MKISILIPTYNRANYLIKNLQILSNFINELNLNNKIEIIISDNCSSDSTELKVTDFINNNLDIRIQFFRQNSNLGLEKNALFVLAKAQSEFVMYLGDDDYIMKDYLKYSIEHLNNNSKTALIIPNFIPVNIEGVQLGIGRDDKLPNRLYNSGFNNCLINSWRGHQLSGLIIRRKGLLESYQFRNVGNIYLFIYFVSFSCLMGDTYHFTEFPVNVTQPGQENKDWNYGKDGLLNEIFNNYLKLPINYFSRTVLQLHICGKQSWRLWQYNAISTKEFTKAFYNIWISKNSTFGFKVLFPLIILLQIVKKIVKKIFNF
jgi:glycosyltransferase involved in cell wall biosynthesis